jgi:asparagine synthase (glutamine-hydrolysing)
MCGINGIVSITKNVMLVSEINKMNDMIIHRGPNDGGIYLDNHSVALGMRRLSIIDLEHGNQPIFNDDASKVIVFNGEIYNYLDLKSNLEAKGIKFSTSSDTEVILRMYEVFGKDCVKHLNGMFSFAIYDKNDKSVFIARDRFGEKPLYYAPLGDQIVWASELKSIINLRPELKVISFDSLQLFLNLSYIPAPHTIFEGVFKLKPGYWMSIDTRNLNILSQKYWDIEPQIDKPSISYKDAEKQLNDLLFDSVQKRMISDVPVGVFLSGGVDSSIVAAIMSKVTDHKIKTFTVGYKNKRYDESDKALTVASHLNSEHFNCLLEYDEVIEDIDKVVLNYDEPFGDPSCLPTYFLSRKTSQFVKVVLTGDGGDEVFAGYNKYLLHTYGRMYQKFVPGSISKQIIQPLLQALAPRNADTKSLITRTKKLFDSIGGDTISNHLNVIQLGFKKDALDQLWAGKSSTDVKKMLESIILPMNQKKFSNLQIARYIDAKISLEGDLLVKVDRASMLASIESRAPFLDHRLMEFSYNLPDNYLIDGINMKKILKSSFSKLLPDKFFNAPKSGFEIPIGTWFRNELKLNLIETLSEDNIQHHGFFDCEVIKSLIDEHLSKKIDHTWKLWTLYSFQKWYNYNF